MPDRHGALALMFSVVAMALAISIAQGAVPATASLEQPAVTGAETLPSVGPDPAALDGYVQPASPAAGSPLQLRLPTTAWFSTTALGPPDGAGRSAGAPQVWRGSVVVDGANRRVGPSTADATLGHLRAGSPVVVAAWVAGEEVVKDNATWAQLSDGSYLYSASLRPDVLATAPPPPTDAAAETGRWLDLNLSLQVLVGYEARIPVHLARTSTGRPGWETPPGHYRIERRVANETMTSSRLLGLDAQRANYTVENVRWTQYFSADGMALHENYWKPTDTFGIPSSHGCAGLTAQDARFFWDWAEVGTPIYAHP